MEKLGVGLDGDASHQMSQKAKKAEAKAEAAERQKASLAEQLARNSEMLAQLTRSWEQKMAQSEEDVNGMASELGLDVSREDLEITPALRNLNMDALLNGRLVHMLYPGSHSFGSDEMDDDPDFYHCLGGEGIEATHCDIFFEDAPKRNINLIPKDGMCLVNGKPATKETPLKHNDRLVLGLGHVFVVFDPQVAMMESGGREKRIIDWETAQEEVAAGLNAMVSKQAQRATKQLQNEWTLRLQVEKLKRNRAVKETVVLRAQVLALDKKGDKAAIVKDAVLKTQKAEEELKIALAQLASVTKERDAAVKKLDELGDEVDPPSG